MKKSLLILSMLAFAATASAYDTFEPGTADSPNYYIIQANRGTFRFLGEKVTTVTSHEVSLGRYEHVTPECIWEVTPGNEDNSVFVKNHNNGKYLMKFMDSDWQETVAAEATATLADTPIDIFPVDKGGAYALNIVSATGASYSDKCYSLDAGGGTSQTCGNYIPTSATSTEGSHWWMTKVEVENGQSLDEAIAAASALAEVRLAAQNGLSVLQGFVNDTFAGENATAAIAELNALDLSNATVEDVEAIVNKGTLESALANKTFRLRNCRTDATEGNDNVYLTVRDADYRNSSLGVDAKTLFKFIPSDDNSGLYVYNAYTGTYIASQDGSMVPKSDKSAAQLFYPVACDDGYGFPMNSNHSGNGIHQQVSGYSLFYTYNADGSVWKLEQITDAFIGEYVEYYVAPYIPNVPASVAAILQQYIDESEAKAFDDYDLHYESAIATASKELETCLDGDIWTLKNLRRAENPKLNHYLAVNLTGNDYESVEAPTNETAAFKFVTIGNGGYNMYNEKTKRYIGLQVVDEAEGTQGYVPVEDAASAQAFYPVLVASGAGYKGVSFPINADHTGSGFNVNQLDAGKAVPWSYIDDGSVWAVSEFDEEAIVAEVVESYASDLTAFGQNVPMVKSIMDEAIAELDKLTYSSTLVDDAHAIESQAIEDGTAYINMNLHGKNFSLYSLGREKYARFTESGFGSHDSNDDVATHFAFKKADDGGYIMGNANCSKFMGPIGEVTEGGTPMTVVENEADAQKVYPMLHKYGSHCGVVLPLSQISRAADSGVHMGGGGGFYQWTINDGNSIYAIENHGETTGIVEISEARAEGIYDLSGRRLAAPVKGINIINGKKVLVK